MVRIFDTASQGISPASSVHPRGALLLATTKPQAPSAIMTTAALAGCHQHATEHVSEATMHATSTGEEASSQTMMF